MKKTTLGLIAASTLLMAGCANDEPLVNGSGYHDGYLEFSIEMPGGFTRDVADGLKAKDLNYAVFAEDGKYLFGDKLSNVVDNNRTANVKIPLVNDKTYQVAFFAQSPESAGIYTISEGVLNIDYSAECKANLDYYDAFYKMEKIKVSAGMPKQTVKLYRPFAQVNIGASDWAASKTAGVLVTDATLTYTADVYTTLNLVDGTVDNMQAVDFTLNTLPEATGDKTANAFTPAKLNVENVLYDHIAMTYVLVPAEESPTTVNTVTFTYTNPVKGDKDLAVRSVPVKRNHRTNIVGTFFTTTVDYDIIIDQEFEDPDLKPIEPDVVIAAGANAQADFEAALKSVANNDDSIIIGLPANTELTMPSTVKGKVTLLGNGPSSVVNMSGQISIANDITFEDIKMIRSSANYVGFQHTAGEHYKNCTMEGTLWTYAYDVSFENCIFDPKATDSYAVWCYGAPNPATGKSAKIVFNKCQFTGDNKAILIYNEGATSFDVSVNNCTFTATQDQSKKDNKCAIQMHTELGTCGKLTINKSKATGFADFNGGLWREVANNPKPAKVSDKFLITVDGVVINAADKE